jgi:flagellar biogenesis protein FliO
MDGIVFTAILLVMVFAMYAAAGFARKRLGIGAGTVKGDALRIVGKRALDRSKALYVVEIGDRYVLLGTAENSVAMIDHITPEEFARMTETEDGRDLASVSPLARLASIARPAAATDTAADGEEEGEGAAATAAPGEFMSVRQSFTYFMGKARSRRAAGTADEIEDATKETA